MRSDKLSIQESETSTCCQALLVLLLVVVVGRRSATYTQATVCGNSLTADRDRSRLKHLSARIFNRQTCTEWYSGAIENPLRRFILQLVTDGRDAWSRQTVGSACVGKAYDRPLQQMKVEIKVWMLSVWGPATSWQSKSSAFLIREKTHLWDPSMRCLAVAVLCRLKGK
ncbi:unnamed protein product [Pleuronectes platessa]|uniref:Uncharacterized protein n=1 Tax=Pleuronectes platessa TaxID=8262 RepID=A0A9N7VUY5_PLEPL|nr:unnamed protein product [Pleuronectes platessa]